MNSKKYRGIIGVLNIICASYIGLLIGCIAIYYSCNDVPFLDTQYSIVIVNLLLLLLAVAGYIGVLIRGFCQIKSLFKPSIVNVPVVFCTDVLELIFIISSYSPLTYYSLAFDSDMIYEVTIFIYIVSVSLILIDAIVSFITIRKEKISIFDEVNCLSILRNVSRVSIPVLLLGLVLTFRAMIIYNIREIKMNESVSSGFDSFVMTDFDGNEYTEDMLKGHKVNMVNIWGTFCHPCIREMPELEMISEMYDASDFQLIGITGDLYVAGKIDQGKIDEALNIIDKTGVKYTVLIPSKEIMAGIVSNIQCYPTTIFLDEEGEVLKIVEGAMSGDDWIEVIDEVMASEQI